MKSVLHTKEEAFTVHTLRREFSERCARNTGYSLRGFAKSLGTSHTVLSLVLNGKRPPSRTLSRVVQEQLSSSLKDRYEDIGLERFSEIATWVHYAILGLIQLPGFKDSPQWIGKKLQIPPLEAKLAFQILVHQKLVKKKAGKWVQSVPPITVRNTRSTLSSRAFNSGLLKKAEQSLDSVPFEKRDLTSIIFPMRTHDVGVAKEKIKAFRRMLAKEFEQSNPLDAVYCLAIQLIPLSQEKNT